MNRYLIKIEEIRFSKTYQLMTFQIFKIRKKMYQLIHSHQSLKTMRNLTRKPTSKIIACSRNSFLSHFYRKKHRPYGTIIWKIIFCSEKSTIFCWLIGSKLIIQCRCKCEISTAIHIYLWSIYRKKVQ